MVNDQRFVFSKMEKKQLEDEKSNECQHKLNCWGYKTMLENFHSRHSVARGAENDTREAWCHLSSITGPVTVGSSEGVSSSNEAPGLFRLRK